MTRVDLATVLGEVNPSTSIVHPVVLALRLAAVAAAWRASCVAAALAAAWRARGEFPSFSHCGALHRDTGGARDFANRLVFAFLQNVSSFSAARPTVDFLPPAEEVATLNDFREARCLPLRQPRGRFRGHPHLAPASGLVLRVSQGPQSVIKFYETMKRNNFCEAHCP